MAGCRIWTGGGKEMEGHFTGLVLGHCICRCILHERRYGTVNEYF